MVRTGTRLSIFPLAGALLFPRGMLSLHVFEPRYRALVRDALARDRRIAMIQPLPTSRSEPPALFDIGCVGRVANVEALDDGCFNLVLKGVSRFRMLREIDVATPFRQIEATFEDYETDADEDQPVLASIQRAALEQEGRRFAEAQGYRIDWASVERIDDETLVNGIAQAAPFDSAAKQALLEAVGIVDRADLLIELMRFFATRSDDDDRATLQ